MNMLKENVSLEGKTVLVTGAAGFIGANLVRRLLSEVKDIRVVGIDSITDYYDVNIKYERLREIEALAAGGTRPDGGQTGAAARWRFVRGWRPWRGSSGRNGRRWW